MVTIEIKGKQLIVNVQGWDRLWALKSRMTFPIKNISSVHAEPSTKLGWWKGIRAPGTHIPGVIVAGTYYRKGKRVFWDVKNPKNTVVINLIDERYNQLVVEVDDPTAVVAQIEKVIVN